MADKKPDPDAYQFDKDAMRNFHRWPLWLQELLGKPITSRAAIWRDDSNNQWMIGGCLNNKQYGPHKIAFDDWITRGRKGEIILRKPDVFEVKHSDVLNDKLIGLIQNDKLAC